LRFPLLHQKLPSVCILEFCEQLIREMAFQVVEIITYELVTITLVTRRNVIDSCIKRMAKRAGLENVRFHDLRHTFASLMLLRRAKPKVISEALGHSSVAFTMDVYSHIIEGMQSNAMVLLDEVLPLGKNRV
jgi:integrase